MTTHFSDEKILLQELKSGNPEAFNYLYQEYRFWMIVQAVSIIKNKEAAEDLVNELLADFWEFRLYENVTASLKGYLSYAVRNRSFNYSRELLSQDKKMQYFPVQDYLIPVNHMENDELIDKLEIAMKKLPPKMRIVFNYFYINGLSQKQIAELTGKSHNTINNQIEQARQYLKKILKK
jgi:RNA polymerase sigma factor (sigma-70 family)